MCPSRSHFIHIWLFVLLNVFFHLTFIFKQTHTYTFVWYRKRKFDIENLKQTKKQKWTIHVMHSCLCMCVCLCINAWIKEAFIMNFISLFAKTCVGLSDHCQSYWYNPNFFLVKLSCGSLNAYIDYIMIIISLFFGSNISVDWSSNERNTQSEKWEKNKKKQRR